MDETTIRNGHRHHAALAQLLRWYLYYEKPNAPIENVLDLLAGDVYMKMAAGEGRGKELFVAANAEVPRDWQNAHVIVDDQFEVKDASTSELAVEIEYSNLGAETDGSLRAARLRYEVGLTAQADSVLPLVSSLTASPIAEGSTTAFTAAYADNRCASLLHYWVALIDGPNTSVEALTEILAEDFELDFPSGSIADVDQLRQWLEGPVSAFDATNHRFENLHVTAIDECSFVIDVEMEWAGIAPDGIVTARTRHQWNVVDNPLDRFAKVKTMTAEILRKVG